MEGVQYISGLLPMERYPRTLKGSGSDQRIAYCRTVREGHCSDEEARLAIAKSGQFDSLKLSQLFMTNCGLLPA